MGPRFGFAWQVRPGTVLRGGYGLFYSSNIGNLDTTVNIPSTFSTNITYISSQDRGFTPFTTLANPFPNGISQPPRKIVVTTPEITTTLRYSAK